MTRALVTQMLNALEHHQSQTRPIHKTEFAITAAREYLATEPKQLGTITFGGCPACGKQSCIARSCMTTEPSGERAELIARLNECLSGPAALTTREATSIKDAADMLEADAGWEQVARAQDAKVRALAGEPGGIEKLREVLAKANPQQAKRVPMTPEHLCALADRLTPNTETGSLDYLLYARAIEAHHVITPAEKPTVDEPEEEDLYALALKADNWGQP